MGPSVLSHCLSSTSRIFSLFLYRLSFYFHIFFSYVIFFIYLNSTQFFLLFFCWIRTQHLICCSVMLSLREIPTIMMCSHTGKIFPYDNVQYFDRWAFLTLLKSVNLNCFRLLLILSLFWLSYQVSKIIFAQTFLSWFFGLGKMCPKHFLSLNIYKSLSFLCPAHWICFFFCCIGHSFLCRPKWLKWILRWVTS